MRTLAILLFAVALTASAHGTRSTHRTHIVNTDGDVRYELVRESDGRQWAAYERNGVRYLTRDSSVIDALQDAMEPYRELSREHSALGRRHSELGREHSQLGREHSRLGREHSRVARERRADYEDEQRALEAEQRKLEAKQRKLEDRQRELEAEQREIESKQRAVERDTNREIEKIFEKAIREGKATRE